MRNMLVAKVLHSPVAHARIRASMPAKAALPGVAAVLTYQDIPRVVYSTAGQSDPIPGPLDSFLTSTRRCALSATGWLLWPPKRKKLPNKALALIEVEYEELPAMLDSRQAMQPGAPICTMSRNMSILPTRPFAQPGR
jgi:putative selenate reductase molybdopterin-binding subunit